MDIQTKVILNAAQEICSTDKKLTKEIVRLYDSAPETFKKYKPKLGQFLIVTKDIDTCIKVASVLGEGKKRNGLSHELIISKYAELFMDKFDSPIEEVADHIRDSGVDRDLFKYHEFNAYIGLLLEDDSSQLSDLCDEYIDSPKEDSKVLMDMHNEPYFGEVVASLRMVLSDRPGAFEDESMIENCTFIHGITSYSFLNERRAKIPLRDIKTGMLTFTPQEKGSVDSFMDKESYIRNIAGAEIQCLIIEWNLLGLNGYQVLYDNPVTVREVQQITELAYFHMAPYELDYHRTEDLFTLISYAISLYRERVFQKHYKKLFKALQKDISTKRQKAEITDTVTEKIDALTEENRLLKRKLMVAERNQAALQGSLKEANRQIYELNTQIPKPIEEEKIIIPEPVLEELPKEETDEERLDRFTEYINGHKVLVWGCRDNYIRNMQDKFPQITFMGNGDITKQQLKSYNFVVMRLDNTGHTKYYGIRKIVDKSGLPTCFMAKGENSVVNLVNKVIKAVEVNG